MKIGIDARLYGTKHRGIGRYVKKLVDGVVKSDLENSYVIFLTKDNFDNFKINSPKVKKVLLDVKWYSLKEQFVVPGVIKKEKLDLVHFPHFNVPYFFNQKFIVTIHDLIINHFPDSRATTLPNWQYQFKLWCYKQIIKRTIKKSAKVIVPTFFVKQDLLNYYRANPDKIQVTYEGCPLKNNGQFADINHFGISKPFLLYVGAAYPHKNLERLIKVFKEFNKEGNYQLVLVGDHDYFYKRLKELARGQLDIIFTGFVSENELSALYNKGRVYIFPSLSEGFGLPVIEAQAHDLPVISSNKSSLPEILNDSVVYFEPEDETEMLNKIKQIMSDEGLRTDLIRKGNENIKRFSWQKMVDKTIAIYLSV